MAQKPTLLALLLRESPPSHLEYSTTALSISSYSYDLLKTFHGQSTCDLVLLHTDRVLPRLEKLFKAVQPIQLPPNVSEELFKGLVLPLIQGNDQLITVDQSFSLVGSAIPIIAKTSPSCFGKAAEILVAVDGLLERLLSHERYSEALKELLISKKDHVGKSLTMSLTDRLVSMTYDCNASHGIESTCHEWKIVRPLMASLEALARSIGEDESRSLQKTRDLPLLAGMRILNFDDKKTNIARQSKTKGFTIPESILKQLSSLDIGRPGSLRAIQSVQEELEGERVDSILRTVLESYPCRFCWERLIGAMTIPKHKTKSSEHSVGNSTKYDIFGKRVGLWKVLLSDRALKSCKKLAQAGKNTSLQQSSSTRTYYQSIGTFGLVERKLRELASGQWKNKGISNYAGSKKQIQEMRVPILQARITQELSILWQIDVGFYDNQPGERQQIVKGKPTTYLLSFH